MIAFVIFINLLFIIVLYSVRNVKGMNPYFIYFHIFGMVLISFIYLYTTIKQELRPFEVGELVKKTLGLIILLLSIVIVSRFAHLLPYGSIFLALFSSTIAGYISFIVLKKHQKKQKISELNIFRLEIAKGAYILLIIFLFGFLLRLLVFGLPKIPIGYDVPMYLLQAIKGAEMPFSNLLMQGLSFGSNPYLDTINFATLWLGSIAKFLNIFGLDPLLIPKIIMPLIDSFSIFALYFLVKSLTNKKIALYSSLVFATLPAELLFSDLYKEIFGKFWLILSLGVFVDYIKKRSFIKVLFFLISIFFLWKTAITAFAKMVIFSVAYITYLILSKRLNKAELITFSFMCLILLGVIYLYKNNELMMNLVPHKSSNAQIITPYTYYAFPIIALTNMTAFLITIFYFFKVYTYKGLSHEEISALSFSLPIFLTLIIVNFFISTLLGYHIFPSSPYLYNLRFSIYMDIPLAIITGLFLYNTSINIKEKNLKIGLIFTLLLLLSVDFGLTACKKMTIHKPRLTQFISADVYDKLQSLSIKGYDNVICVGKFDWTLENASNYSFGNWIKYLIYSKIGKEPIMIGSIDELKNMKFKDNEKVIVLDCQKKDIKQVFIYNHKQKG